MSKNSTINIYKMPVRDTMMLNTLLYAFICLSCVIILTTTDALFVYMPVFYVFTFVHCTACYSPATKALINNNNNTDTRNNLIISMYRSGRNQRPPDDLSECTSHVVRSDFPTYVLLQTTMQPYCRLTLNRIPGSSSPTDRIQIRKHKLNTIESLL